MKEIRKRVSELKPYENVKGYGIIGRISKWGDSGDDGWCNVWPEFYTSQTVCDRWPADAEVTVLVKEKRWRRTIIQETTHEKMAESWRAQVGTRNDSGGFSRYSPVEEVE